MLPRILPALVSAALLVGCAYPKTIRVYDEECGITAKKMVLDVSGAGTLGPCINYDCIAQLVTQAAFLGASTVVSGSIVVAGNVVYWLEKQKDCKPRQILPAPASPTT
ncbi:MAG TPA: hypothetical protein VFL64_09890 [Rhizobacter sp.]|nr:hypothetical protein [Rhizobacter sp.]